MRTIIEAALATTSSLNSTYNHSSGSLTGDGAFPRIDGFKLLKNELILVKNQSNPHENGVYRLTITGNTHTNWKLERYINFEPDNSSPDYIGGRIVFVYVDKGTIQTTKDSWWLLTYTELPSPSGWEFIRVRDIYKSQINILDCGAIGDKFRGDITTADKAQNDKAFQQAFKAINIMKGGEIYIPNGTYRLSKGLRGTETYFNGDDGNTSLFYNRIMSDTAIMGNRSVGQFQRAMFDLNVKGIDDANHDYFEVNILNEGSVNSGTVSFEWFRNRIKQSTSPIVIPSTGICNLADTSIELVFNPATEFLLSDGQGNLVERNFSWIGNGCYFLHDNTRITGESTVNTILEFDFSSTGGAGDGIRALWNTVQAGRFIEIKNLTLKNVSPQNAYQISNILKSAPQLPDIKVLQSPYNPEFDFKLTIKDIDEETGMPTFVSCHYTLNQRPEILHLRWREAMIEDDIPIEFESNHCQANLLKSGLTIRFDENQKYVKGSTYEWHYSGYAGTGILCVGDSKVTIENVTVLGFEKGIVLNSTLLSKISNCNIFSYSPFSGVGIWYTANYISGIGAAGVNNIHLVENTTIGDFGAGIWQESGLVHTIRQIDFESTRICVRMGDMAYASYENLYTEGVCQHGGAIFETTGNIRSISITNSGFYPRVFNPVIRNKHFIADGYNYDIDNLNFSNNTVYFTDVPAPDKLEKMKKRFIMGADSIRNAFWNSTFAISSPPGNIPREDALFDHNPSNAYLFLSNPPLGNTKGLGIGTMAPKAHLHLRQWSNNSFLGVPALPLLQIEGTGENKNKSYKIENNLNTIGHTIGLGSAFDNDPVPKGFFRTTVEAITYVGNSLVNAYIYPIKNEQYLVAEVTIIVATDGGGVGAYWKIRAYVRKAGNELIIISKVLDEEVVENPGFLPLTIEAETSGSNAIVFNVHQGDSRFTGIWVINIEITQSAR
jgi:hypothetical protein